MKRMKLQTSAVSVWLTSPMRSFVPCAFSLTLLFLQPRSHAGMCLVCMQMQIARRKIPSKRSVLKWIFPSRINPSKLWGFKQERCVRKVRVHYFGPGKQLRMLQPENLIYGNVTYIHGRQTFPPRYRDARWKERRRPAIIAYTPFWREQTLALGARRRKKWTKAQRNGAFPHFPATVIN